MKLHFYGKYNGDESLLPQREHPQGYVAFREPQNMKKFSIIITLASFFTLIIMWCLQFIRCGYVPCSIIGGILAIACMIPHEYLHAVWFKEDVFMFVNSKQGMLFVVGTEEMSKVRFIIMSLCPNVVFGFIPYLLFMINPSLTVLGTMGVLSLCTGVGDYLNVVNACIQMPKGAVTYLSGFHSFWYIPPEGNKEEN